MSKSYKKWSKEEKIKILSKSYYNFNLSKRIFGIKEILYSILEIELAEGFDNDLLLKLRDIVQGASEKTTKDIQFILFSFFDIHGIPTIEK